MVDPSNNLVSPALRRLLTLWEEGCARDGLPTRDDFPAEKLMTLGGRVVLIDVEPDPFRLRYRLIGTEVTRVLGRDSTGRYFDEIYAPEFYRHQADHFSRVVRDRVALRTHGNMAHSHKPYVAVEAIDLPLADGSGAVTMILRGLEFEG